MSIESLQEAIVEKNADKVVSIMAKWNESQREAAIEPFNLLMQALNYKQFLIQPCTESADVPAVEQLRQRFGIDPARIDLEIYYVAWLTRFGLERAQGGVSLRPWNNLERQLAQVLADRRPSWFADWLKASAVDSAPISSALWALLYQHGLVSDRDIASMALYFAIDLPHGISTAPEPVLKVLRDVPAILEQAYEIPNIPYQRFNASTWTAAMQWLSDHQLLDQVRMWKSLIQAIHSTQNQTERNGCVMLAKATNADATVLKDLQPQLLGLIGDSQSSVVGFAIEQLAKVQGAGALNGREAIAALPGAFSHKPKSHSMTALGLLTQIAEDESLRSAAVEAGTAALMHPNKEVQQAALSMLERWLRPEDAAAIQAISLHRDSIAETLKSRTTALLEFRPIDSAKKTSKTSGSSAAKPKKIATVDVASTGDTAADGTPVGWEIHIEEVQRAVESLPPELCERMRMGPALDAARIGAVDWVCRWNIQDVRVLASARPLVPVKSVEELVDVTAAAVESCDGPDTVDRIVSGIARLARERPKSFQSLTRSLGKRACEGHFLRRPQRGLVGGSVGRCFSLLIGAWLEIEPTEDDEGFFTSPIDTYLLELAQLVRDGTSYPLISEATHQGGWIDPIVWVDRLDRLQSEPTRFLESDLVRSLLRLAPDHRAEALRHADRLQPPLKAIAAAALGGDVKIDSSSSQQVWITALRARDPWIDLSQQLAPEERAVITEELASLPDVVFPSDYSWQPKRVSQGHFSAGAIDASPLRWNQGKQKADADEIARSLQEAIARGQDPLEIISTLYRSGQDDQQCGGFLTAQLHRLRCLPGPGHTYPYLATQWPMKLDWYWCLATDGLSRRIESNSSVDEPYGQFLLPLLERDRPLTSMATRALWIATVSKDELSRSMAVEVWIELIRDDRIDLGLLVDTLREVEAGGWVKLNRVGEVLAEVAAVSPLHSWAAASVLDGYLSSCETLPRDAAKLLEPLDECCERLGLAIQPRLAGHLRGIKSGKSAPLARSLLQRQATAPAARQEAVSAALQARLARLRRCANPENPNAQLGS